MVATATGVKNWCQFTFISYYVKNPSREGLEGINMKQPPQHGKALKRL